MVRYNTSISRIGLVLLTAMLMLQCQNEVIEWESKSTDLVITEYIYNNPDQFVEFGDALKYTGIENLLRVRGPFTLFLPSDEAMEAYYASKGVSDITEITREEAEDLVYNHILQGEVSSGAMGLGTLPYKNGLGDFVASDFEGIDILLNKKAIIIDRDIPTSNGYVHQIDKVLEPITKTVIEVLTDMGGYSIFLEGLDMAGLTDTLKVIEFPYGQTTARSRYTILSVPDTLYYRSGVNSVEDLIELYAEGEDDLTSGSNKFNQYMVYHCLSGTHYFSDFLPDDIYYVITGDNYLNIKVEDDFKINKTDSSYVGFYFDLSNFPAKNGAIHTVRTTLPNTSSEPVEITHQVTNYFDLHEGAYYLNYYQRFHDGESTFEYIKWEGGTFLYYLKPGHHLMDDDAIKMEGDHYWIEITTPKIRKGDYHLSGFFFQGGDRGVFACELDGEYIGVVDPNKGSWGGPPISFGDVIFETTERHKIKLTTIQPGRVFWDYVRFTPID